MTTLTMRPVKGDFIVTGPDVEPMKFKSRPEARDWCKAHQSMTGPGGDRSRQTHQRAPLSHGGTAFSSPPRYLDT